MGSGAVGSRPLPRGNESLLRLAEEPRVPFDRAIAPDNPEGNARVESLIDSLLDQTDLLELAFELYVLSRIPDPL